MLPSLGTLKGVGSGLLNAGRGALFMGATQGASTGGKVMNGLGHAAALAPVAAGSFKATSQQPGFKPQSTVKTSEDSPGEKKPSLLGSVAEGAGYGALAGTPFGYLRGNSTANASHAFMNARERAGEGLGFQDGFRWGGRTMDAPDQSAVESRLGALMHAFHPNYVEDRNARNDGPYPRRVVSDALTPVVGGAVLGGLAGGARHLWNEHKKTEKTSEERINSVIARVLRAKFASGPAWHRPVNALSYAAFAAPYLSNKIHDNKPLTTALNAAGILGLGATNADSLRHGDPIAGYDLAGLGLMGAGMVHSALRPSPTPDAGH